MQPFKSFQALLLIAFSISPTLASLDGPCSVNGDPGICLTTGSCAAGGGTSHPGFCPGTPINVQCCTKLCGNGGTCLFTDNCVIQDIVFGLCPGPSNFACCVPEGP